MACYKPPVKNKTLFLCHKNIFFSWQKIDWLLKTETIHFVQSLKLVLVSVKLLKPLEPKPVCVPQKSSEFYVFFNSIWVISEWWKDDCKGCVQWSAIWAAAQQN